MNDKTPKRVIREELHKLSSLSWGQRLGYIWDYYKPLMAAVLVVIFLISMGVEIYHNKQIERLLNVHLINCGDMLGDTEELTAQFAAYIGGLEEKQQISIDATMVLSDSTDQSATANQVKFVTLSAANELEVLLIDAATFERYYEQGYFADLSDYLSEQQLGDWSEHLVYREKVELESESETAEADSPQAKADAGEASEEIPAALDLTGSAILQEYGFYADENVYGCVFARAGAKDLYGQFFSFLLQ